MSTPAIQIFPEAGASTPRIILMVVVLPAPFGPKSPTISLRPTSNEMPSTASISPYVLDSCVTDKTFDIEVSYSAVFVAGRCGYQASASEMWDPKPKPQASVPFPRSGLLDNCRSQTLVRIAIQLAHWPMSHTLNRIEEKNAVMHRRSARTGTLASPT